MSGYRSIVKAVAGLDFDFYHATKHYGMHFLWARLGVEAGQGCAGRLEHRHG
jgi:hypothetical protein